MWLNIDSRAAVHNWLSEHGEAGDIQMLVPLMPFLFTILETLHYETRKLPIQPTVSGVSEGTTDSPNGITFGLWLLPKDYATVRVILALSGDLIDVLDKIKSLPGLKELGSPISTMRKEVEKFRAARDFFTHMDEVWRDFSKHGADGPFDIANRSRYTVNAKNRVYLLWHDDTIYFTHHRERQEVRLRREEFDSIFECGRQLMAALRNNRESMKQKDSLVPIEKIFPKDS